MERERKRREKEKWNLFSLVWVFDLIEWEEKQVLLVWLRKKERIYNYMLIIINEENEMVSKRL